MTKAKYEAAVEFVRAEAAVADHWGGCRACCECDECLKCSNDCDCEEPASCHSDLRCEEYDRLADLAQDALMLARAVLGI